MYGVEYEPCVCNYTMIFNINALHIPCLLLGVDDEVVNSDGASSDGVSVREVGSTVFA